MNARYVDLQSVPEAICRSAHHYALNIIYSILLLHILKCFLGCGGWGVAEENKNIG